MSNEETHAGTGHYCRECMHLIGDHCMQHGQSVTTYEGDGEISADDGCPEFIPSLAARQVEQMRIGNELLGVLVEGYVMLRSGGPGRIATVDAIRESIRGPKCKP